MLLLPFLALGVLFAAGLVDGILQSLGIIPALGLTQPTLAYYAQAFENESILNSIGFSLYVSAVSSLIAAIAGVFLCAAIAGAKKDFGVVKIPIVIPHIVVALFVISIFSQTGMLARILYAFGVENAQELLSPILFTGNGAGIIIAYLWKEIPFVVFFVISVMAGVSGTLGEAAQNLGATRKKAFFQVTLPMCMPAVKNAFLIIFAFSFGAYELPFLLGATAPKALPVQAYIEYTHPDLLHRPYAMAINGIMLMIAFAAALVYYLFMQRDIKKLNGTIK